jgi:pimeloyl-ACP methyl ester carboxylesterase
MRRRTFVASVVAAGGALAGLRLAFAKTDTGTPTEPSTGGSGMADAAPATGYAPVNGLRMYYEVHGSGEPLVLLHGAYGMIDLWGPILDGLAKTRQVIAVEQQAHGHTADVDRPLRYEQMAEDTAALMRHLGIARADVFGYSMGANTGLQLAMRHPDLVRKLVAVSPNYRLDGYYPELLAMIQTITPEVFAGSPIEEAYLRNAPNPDDWPTLIEKLKDLDAQEFAWPEDDVRAIAAPTLVMIGDSDGVRPEHAVELFRLRGGGVPGDLVGLPPSQLAVLPGTTHVSIVVERADWLLAMCQPFLDAPMPEAG